MAKGNVRELSKGRYELRYDLPVGPDGKRRQKSETVKGTKTDANRRLREILGELDKGTYVEPCKLSVAEYLAVWLKDGARQKTGRAAFQRYEEIVRVHLVPALGAIPLEKLKPIQIQQLFSQKSETLRTSTLRHIYSVLHGALKQAVKWELLSRDPSENIELPREKKREVTVYDEGQIAQLLTAAEGTCYSLPIFLAVHTGMRLGEICILRWDDIDFEERTLRIDEAIEQTREGLYIKPPKNGDTRTISISGDVVSFLLRHRGEQAQDKLRKGAAGVSPRSTGFNPLNLVWPDQQGQLRKGHNFSCMFRRFILENDLPRITFHSLRHYHCVTLLQKLKVPLKVVADRVGHRNPTITLGLYGNHSVSGLDREAAEGIERFLKSA